MTSPDDTKRSVIIASIFKMRQTLTSNESMSSVIGWQEVLYSQEQKHSNLPGKFASILPIFKSKSALSQFTTTLAASG